MAMKTSTPWWITGVLFFGLLCLFAGQRALAHLDTTSTVLTGLGLLCVVGATGVRVWAFTRESGRRRAVEGVMLLCHAGVGLALLVYFFVAAKEGVSHKTYIIASVAWLILMGLSLIPLFMIEASLGFVGRDWFPAKGEKVADEAAVELFRVKEMALNGLSIALAAAFLMVTCNTMKDRDISKDVSYFKTSGPGSATVAMVNKMNAPLRVLIFFPDVNQVADEVESYFRQLGDATGKVVVERHDRLVSPTLAKEHKVNADGTIVLLRGEPEEKKGDKKDEKKPEGPQASQSEKITLPTDFSKARKDKLREFDGDVQKALMKVVRPKRVAYFSVGHGELNDPKSTGPMEMQDPLARSTLLKQLMSLLNYEVKDWDGFGKPVPDDCTILFVLGPRHELLEEELKSIDDYLERGGSLLLVLDPQSQVRDLGPLEGRLGVHFDPGVLMDDKEFMVQQHNNSDHRLILTNQFSSHASVTTLSRGGVRSGILLIESGHLLPHDFMVEQGKQPPKRTWVVRSMSSSFVDLNGDREYNDGAEKRDRYNIGAAIEDENDKKDKDKEDEKAGMRAMVFADSEAFSDVLLRKVPLIQALVVDAVKWLGGEEDLAGETISEKDVLIEHTKSEDVVWFYLSIVGAPVLILGLGLSGVMWRRRRAQRRKRS
jgi:hypothetical protein